MYSLHVPPLGLHLRSALQHKLDNKAKPVGSLGMLEHIALRLGLIQHTLSPQLKKPAMITVGGDHGVCAEGVSACPQEITWQQMLNFLTGGGGIGLFCSHAGLEHWVVDAGADYDFPEHPRLIPAKIARGTANLRYHHAMTQEQCLTAIENGRAIARKIIAEGSTLLAFGEMGIGNTTPASALMSIFCGIAPENCCGPGAGLNSAQVAHKAAVIAESIARHGISADPLENLARFGGFEIATIAGGMMEAASQGCAFITDGFITTSALLVARAVNPAVLDYCFFGHQSDEQGHRLMIEHCQGMPILKLGLRLGEGTGAALAYPIMGAAAEMLCRMTSFEEGGVANTSHIQIPTASRFD